MNRWHCKWILPISACCPECQNKRRQIRRQSKEPEDTTASTGSERGTGPVQRIVAAGSAGNHRQQGVDASRKHQAPRRKLRAWCSFLEVAGLLLGCRPELVVSGLNPALAIISRAVLFWKGLVL
jgi:hypothetical protein